MSTIVKTQQELDAALADGKATSVEGHVFQKLGKAQVSQ